MKTFTRYYNSYLHFIRIFFLFLTLVGRVSSADAQTIRYVNQAATGNGKGDSWQNAFNELADALKWAHKYPNQWTSPLQIWVASGTYYPKYSPADGNFDTNAGRSNSFLLGDNMQIYGGFTGNESSLDQRNWGVNSTVLSGGIGASGSYDNNYTVVMAVNTSANTVIDGVTIVDGHANGNTSVQFGNTLINNDSGAAIVLIGSAARIGNCQFRFNESSVAGGGIMIYEGSSPVVYNSAFSLNYSEGKGGAISAVGSTVYLVNCSFAGNASRLSGGAVEFDSSPSYIYNSVFWNNGAGSVSSNSAIDYRYSMVQGVTTTDAKGNIDGQVDPWFQEPDLYLNLQSQSPLINKGSTTLADQFNPSLRDLGGNSRIYNRSKGSVIDIGAFEYQLPPKLPVRYVKEGFSGDGYSWENASGDLQEMINESLPGNQIWVAEGSHVPNRKMTNLTAITPNDPENAFVLKEGVSIYGGFAGSETQLSQRDIVEHETALSGQMNGAKTYHVVLAVGAAGQPLTAATKLDGFTITGGSASGTVVSTVNGQPVSHGNGGGIYNYNSSVEFTNIKMAYNYAINLGGGMFNWLATPVFHNLTMYSNESQSGGAIANYQANVKVFNATISGNKAMYGGAFYSIGSSPEIAGALISGNTANYGGAVYNSGSSPTIANATISSNTGSSIQNADTESAPQIRNTVIFGNDHGVSGGSPDYANSLVQGVAGGSKGNLDGDLDPMLDNLPAPGLTLDGRFWMKDCSPLINAGSNAFLPAELPLDSYGNLRIRQNTVDIGVVEYQGLIQTGAVRLSGNGHVSSIVAESGKKYDVKVQNEACRSVAAIRSGGQSAVTGQIDLTTWIDATVQSYNGAHYVQRHYEISPVSEPDKATATITLYFTQPEFTAYNSATASGKIPASPDDVSGKNNLKIFQYHGKPTGGNGPGSYSGTPVTIEPAEDQIIWNGALERWEITFDVVGFSGFFVGSSSSPLPVKLVSFEGKVNDKQSVDLKWAVAEQSGILEYVVEYSADGRSFSDVGRVEASQNQHDVYQFEAKHAFSGNTAYYRLRILEADAQAFSRIISVNLPEVAGPIVYPMPARDNIWLKGQKIAGSKVQLVNRQGLVVKTFDLRHDEQQIDISTLPAGTYLLQLPYGISRKVVKQ